MTSNALSTSFTANMSIITAALALSFFQIQADTASKYEIAIPITISESSAAGPLSSDITVFIRQKPISTIPPQALQSQSANMVSQRLYLILGFAAGGLVLCGVFILCLRHQMTKREKQRQEMRQAVKAQETNDEPEETDGPIETKPKRQKLKESPQKPLRSKKRTPVTTLTPEETDGAVKRKVNRQLFTSTNPGPEGEMEPAASTPRARARQLPSAASAFAQHCQARLGVELTEYQDGETYDNPLHDESEWGAGDADDVRLQVNDRFTSTASTINDSPNRLNTSTYYPTANDSSRHNSWDSENSTGAFTASNMTTPSKYTNSSSRYTTTPSKYTSTPSRHTTAPFRQTHHAASGGVPQESYMPQASSTAPASYISGPTPRRSPSNLGSATAPVAPTISHQVTPPRRAVPSPLAIITDASASVPLAPSTPRRTPLREPPPADPTGTPRAGATAGFRSPIFI